MPKLDGFELRSHVIQNESCLESVCRIYSQARLIIRDS